MKVKSTSQYHGLFLDIAYDDYTSPQRNVTLKVCEVSWYVIG